MSGHAKPTSADSAADIHINNHVERTLSHDTETGPELHSKSDDRRMSQEWISEKEWIDYVKGDPGVRHRLPSVVSIFKVPKFLKDTKREAYVPQRVSLGPHHHRRADLRAMGHHKGRALRTIMARFNINTNLDIYPNDMDFATRAREKILQVENEISDSYEESIDCDGETLARMLCLDGCFLLEVLRTLGEDTLSRAKVGMYYDPIFGENKIDFAASDILDDILMLENQIPFTVLRQLLQLECNSAVDVEEKLLDLLDEGTSCLFNIFKDEKFNKKEMSSPKQLEEQVHHLLGFLHKAIAYPHFNRDNSSGVHQGECNISIKCCYRECMIIMLRHKNRSRNDVEISVPGAVELRNAGIKFKPCDGGIKEIKFDPYSATIFLPPIRITDTTEILFRNLIAYEMCKPFETNYVTCYVKLMDDLIDSPEDVALLKKMDVLKSWLGSDKEVADLFNALCKGVTVSMEDVFDKLTYKVNEHYKSKLKVICAEFVRVHFSSPWNALAWLGAIFVLILTVLQTIYTIISVYK